MQKKPHRRLWLTHFFLACLNVSHGNSSVINIFEDNDSRPIFNNLVIDKNTGCLFVGAINRLYQLTPDLNVTDQVVTGPVEDSFECSAIDCPNSTIKHLTDNVNKVLVIDYTTSRIITCGSVSQGMCTVRNLSNISDTVQTVKEAVVANDLEASTVAFIAPGPPSPPTTKVMYIGVTFTGNSIYRSHVPAIASRSLDSQNMLNIAYEGVTSSTRVHVNSQNLEDYLINYVYGFSSETFSYFLTTQKRSATPPSPYISKMVRLCHEDKSYYSYTEIPLECTSKEQSYNLVQAGYVGKIGYDLATDLGITPQEDVLFAVFSSSESELKNKPNDQSALCVYSLKSIRRTFLQNINACFSGKGNLGLDFILPSLACARTKLHNITEDFCGMDVNTPLGGDSPIAAVPVLMFNTRLTAVTATSTGVFTVVFVGTNNGHVKKLVVESSVKAIEYGGIVIQENSPINRDLIFDARQMHLYAMTKSRVSMVKVQDCHMYSSCLDCLAAKDPYCGWCSLENKCSSRSNCEEKETDPFYWKPYNSGMCTTIASVTPSQIQKNTTRTLELEIDNYPLLEESLFCVFSVFDEDFITNAHYRPPNGVNCTSPQTNSLPNIPPNQHYFTTNLSVKTTRGSNFVATNFTFFDCSTYTTCTQCVDSSFPCDWCLEADKCTHDTAENCKNDILVSNVKLVESGYRIGPSICPSIKGSYSKSNEILVPSGVKTSIRVEVDQYDQFSTQTRFECRFNIEGSIFNVNATLLEDTINCELREFSFNSQVTNVSATFSVIWGGSKSLENPHDIHLVIYRCNDMADNCGMCLSMPEKYRCGWCPTSNHCEVLDTCNQEPVKWLDQNMTCPEPQITSFWPLAGPWDGLTNITIVGINLGKKINDIYSGVTVAGLRCTPYAHLYEISRKIICRLDGLDSVDNMREGPIVVQVGGFRGESKSNYQFVNPIITGLHPRYGPKSGGTTLTIKGNYMNAGSNIQVLFEDTLPCVIINNTLTETSCVTSTSDSQKVVTIKMFFDKSERDFDNQTYQYTDDPSVESVGSSAPGPIKVPKGIVSGGIKVSVSGKNFEFVQNPRLYVYYLNKSYFGDCFVLSNSNLICESPKVTPLQRNQPDPDKPIELDYGFKMDNVKDVENISMKTGFSKFMLFPDPVYTKFDKNIKFHNGDYLTLNGSNLDRACQETDVTVRIGKSYCIVTSLSRYQLNCRPPTEQLKDFSESNGLSSSPEFPDVFVIVGSSLNFSIGKLSYAQPPVHKTSDSFPGIIGLAVIGLAIIFIFAILIAFTNHYHKSSEMSRILQNMENQMDLLEIRVASECKNAFAELQTEIMDIAGDLTSGGIPFVDYHTYTMHILFPHMEDHELLQREKSGLIQQEKGICLFGQLILNKTFLLLFIRSMENNRYFSMRDRFNVASLIMVSLQNKMEYCTDILKTLLAEFIEKCMQGNCHPKLLLRRTESVVEKMLSSWFACLLYKFLRDSAGEPLYILFKAMKHQVYKGPVDAITSKAKYSLSEDKLIRQSIDFVPMTVYVSISQHTALVNELDLSTGNIPVKVLDCDTVSQVKEKALDTIYRAMPFSKLPQTRDLIVEWRTGSSSRLILHDDDSSTVTENGWRKCNTLQHYMVPDGAYLNLVPVEQIPTNHLSLLSDIIDEYKYEMMSFAQSNCGSTNNSRTTLISDNVQTGGVEYWHLVEPHDIDAKKEGERRNNMVPEIYLTRLLGTKYTLQKFVDDLFEMIFSTAYRGSALPFAIKYMFDFLDDQAVRYGITDQEVVHTWKNNSLPLRFWVNLIKNPNFVFDIQKSNIIDSCLSVVAQIFMDSCSTSDHRLGKDSPSSKLLYAKEIPRYKDMVTRYYRDIKTMPPISDEDMNAMLAEESSIHVAEFDENWALCELYAYAKKYKEQLMVTLQEDESAQKQQLAHKLEQVYSMMMAEK